MVTIETVTSDLSKEQENRLLRFRLGGDCFERVEVCVGWAS